MKKLIISIFSIVMLSTFFGCNSKDVTPNNATNNAAINEETTEVTPEDSVNAETKAEDSVNTETKAEDSVNTEAKAEDSANTETKTEDSVNTETKTEDSANTGRKLTIEIDKKTSSHALNLPVIQREINKGRSDIEYCMKKEGDKDVDIIAVVTTDGHDGKVLNITTQSNDPYPEVSKCLKKRIPKIQFATTKEGNNHTVGYHFTWK